MTGMEGITAAIRQRLADPTIHRDVFNELLRRLRLLQQ